METLYSIRQTGDNYGGEYGRASNGQYLNREAVVKYLKGQHPVEIKYFAVQPAGSKGYDEMISAEKFLLYNSHDEVGIDVADCQGKAYKRLLRAYNKKTGCTLTWDMVQALGLKDECMWAENAEE